MQKKTIILIICILVIIMIAMFFGLVISKNNSDDANGNVVSNVEDMTPVLELIVEVEDDVTIIHASASIEGDYYVESIILPDGEIVEDDEAEYEVKKTGDYEFTATASNGISVTETITIDELDEASANNPYIPDGFTHVSGTDVETGYIIQDENGNEYVWIPVETGILTRNTENNSQYEENDSTATGLYNSVAKYYGFYIARYEASQTTYNGTETVASVKNVIPWSNITYEECYEVSKKAASVYEYSDIKTALMNSYAWDSTLVWIDETETNYSSNTGYGNYSGTILKTGETENDEVNSICDLAGNLREWTTEIYYPETNSSDNENETNEVLEENTSEDNEVSVSDSSDDVYRVIRGGSANINKTAGSHIGQLEKMSDSYWGFRIILYKD